MIYVLCGCLNEFLDILKGNIDEVGKIFEGELVIDLVWVCVYFCFKFVKYMLK